MSGEGQWGTSVEDLYLMSLSSCLRVAQVDPQNEQMIPSLSFGLINQIPSVHLNFKENA